jgi:glycosyltransferase involved in cell wall biosynthesis
LNSLAIVATHPIQYYAPLYRYLAKTSGLDLKVYYHHLPNDEEQGVQFNRAFQWDIDLLSGYSYAFGSDGRDELLKGISSRRWNAIIVHGWFDSFSKVAIQTAFSAKVPVMIRGDSHLRTPRPFLKKILKYPVFRFFLPKISMGLAVGKWNADYYRHYGVSDSKIVYSPHCVDNDWFKGQAASQKPYRQDLRKKWNIPPEHFVFLYIGRMNPMKRVGDFLEAFKRVHTQNPNTHALLVGDGPSFQEVKSQASSLGRSVTFTGFLNQTEIPQAYVASDLLVLPSNGEETWGLVVNEALCCGVPCIVSDQVGCGVDMIKSGVTGEIFPCGDVESLAKKMEAAIPLKENGKYSEKDPSWLEILKTHSCETAARGVLNGLNLVVSS